MTIKREEKNETLPGVDQEFSIYAHQGEFNEGMVRISCTIPKLARKWGRHLQEGREVYNSKSGQLIEIHGILKPGTLRLTKKTELSEEQREANAERLRAAREKTP